MHDGHKVVMLEIWKYSCRAEEGLWHPLGGSYDLQRVLMTSEDILLLKAALPLHLLGTMQTASFRAKGWSCS